jgi:hypothetical protein
VSLLADVDWAATASIATALATLVLAIATFASVRSANRTARAAEQSLRAGLWPILAPSRPDDAEQKVMFQDEHKVRIPGGGAVCEVTPDAIYLAIGLRNVGPGLAVLDRWWFHPDRLGATGEHADVDEFTRLTRDIYIPPGEPGFWQGAFRDPAAPAFVEAAAAITAHRSLTIDLLYGDHLGAQRTISRCSLLPRPDGRWMVTIGKHWNLDGPDPR